MNKNLIFLFLFALAAIFILSFVLPQKGFAISQTSQASMVNAEYLESLRLNASVECLQNSQCSESYECIGNTCINRESINLCPTINLWTPTRRLNAGDNISSIKEIVTGYQFPYLLSDGKIFENINNKTIEYLYSPVIFIGDSKIESENGNYVVKQTPDSGIITLRISFSRSIDFSDSKIKGQALRIMGKEYIIGDNSNNLAIELISNDSKIRLENDKNVEVGVSLSSVQGTNANLLKDVNGNIMGIEIGFNMPENKSSINIAEKYSDPVFNAIQVSFNKFDEGFADVSVGGNCA